MNIEELEAALVEKRARKVELQRMVDEGLNQSQIGDALGLTQSGVSYQMRNLCVKPKGILRREWPIEKIRRWIEVEDRTQEWVGGQLGIRSNQVSRICKQNQIQAAPRGPRSGAKHYAYRGGKRDRNYGKAPREALARAGYAVKNGHVVHHLNFDTRDNRLENLWVFPGQSHHLSWHRQLEEQARDTDATVEALALEAYPPGPDLLHDAIGLVRQGPGAPPSPEMSDPTEA